MKLLRNLISLFNAITCFEIIGLRRRPVYEGEKDRFSYQSKCHTFDIGPEEMVLDVGCGAYPFPFATTLVDLYTEKSEHRREDLKTDGKDFREADINHLPFEDKSYDFVYCSHVLEHVDDPKLACHELIRVGKRGYIETPSLMTDVMFSWAKGMHKWFTIIIADRITFYEYDERLVQGVRNPYWGKSVFSKRYHPLQDLLFCNQDIFNNSLMWRGYFNYSIFYLDGRMEHSDFPTEKGLQRN
jgi:ubiquinone/menaquinone biosynthesis C-methylase UbiE